MYMERILYWRKILNVYHTFKRKTLEAIYLRKLKPTLISQNDFYFQKWNYVNTQD